MATATTPPTIAEPLIPADDILYEVVNGLVVEKPPKGAYEADVTSQLSQILGSYVRANLLGRIVSELLFLINREKDLQRRPDLAFVSHDRWPTNRLVPSEAAWDMVPDLAVEVVSPSNRANDVINKLHEYFQAGVKRVWVVYPLTHEIYVYHSPSQIGVLSVGSVLDDPILFPGFQLPLAELFSGQAE